MNEKEIRQYFLDEANRKYDEVHGKNSISGYTREWYVGWYLWAKRKEIKSLEESNRQRQQSLDEARRMERDERK